MPTHRPRQVVGRGPGSPPPRHNRHSRGGILVTSSENPRPPQAPRQGGYLGSGRGVPNDLNHRPLPAKFRPSASNLAMDAASERVGALKRVYADIILNVTKESASRVLAAESRAMRLQEELAVSREEAIATLLRVKSILDAKIMETEKASLVKTRKIQDLEELIDESRNTIKSLETELNELKEKINTAMGSTKSPNFENVSNHCCNEEDPKECIPISDPILGSPTHDPARHLTTTKISDHKENSLGDCNCKGSAESLQPQPFEATSPEKKCNCDPERSPTMVQMKEPDLLRSGRKQRVRAFDQNTLPQEVCVKHEDQPLKSSQIKNGTVLPPEIVGPSVGNLASDANRVNLQCPVQTVTSSSFPSLKKQRKRRKRMSLATIDQGILSCNSAKNWRNSNQCSHDIIHSNTSPVSMEDDDSRSSCHRKDGFSDDEIKLVESDANVENRISDNEINHVETDAHVENTDKDVVSASESLSSLLEASTLPLNSDGVDKASSTVKHADRELSQGNSGSQSGCRPFGSLNQDTDNGFLKYTFKRKRMKGISGSANKNIANDKWKRTCDKDCVLQENQKPGSLRASSCDSRRVAQVARQLVSLSQQRWG